MGTELTVQHARVPLRRERERRAAQQVRMSTDRQQYSIANQMAVIAAYAAERRLTILDTYIDQGISGLRDQQPTGAHPSAAEFANVLVRECGNGNGASAGDEGPLLPQVARPRTRNEPPNYPLLKAIRKWRGMAPNGRFDVGLLNREKVATFLLYPAFRVDRLDCVGVPKKQELAMSRLARIALVLMLATVHLPAASALDNAPAILSQELVPFSSDEGLARLARSTAKVDFPALANQFEAESNRAFCGPASAAIVLNAVRGRSPDLPRDRSRLHPEDLKYIPSAFDPTIPRFTQENVITKGQKTRAQVLGEPVTINGKQIQDFGYQVRQLDEMLRANGLTTRLVIVDDSKPEQDIRTDLVENLKSRGDYVIVAYQRKAVGQEGPGHISPLGAYDAESDSFLVLDVNPASAGWVWMPTATLIKGMRTFDTVENRGYILVETP